MSFEGEKGVLTDVRNPQYEPIFLLTVPEQNFIIGQRLPRKQSSHISIGWGVIV